MFNSAQSFSLESDPIHESHASPSQLRDAIAWGHEATKVAFGSTDPAVQIVLAERLQQSIEDENRRRHEEGAFDEDDFPINDLSYCLERPVWSFNEQGQQVPACRMLVLSQEAQEKGPKASKAQVVDSFMLVLDPQTRKIVHVND